MEKPLIDHQDAAEDTTARKSARSFQIMDSSSTTTTTGRRYRFSGTKAYMFLFSLVFTASVSIYRSSYYSSDNDSEGGSIFQQYSESQFRLEAGEPLLGDHKASKGKLHGNIKVKSNDQEDDKPVLIDKPLNVVVLYADDWRHDDLGVASDGVVHTPFLDWLSKKQGIRFTHNCVTTSVCWISRATLHTGQYYSRHKATRPKDNEWYAGWSHAFPAVLRTLGYYVAHIGKWHSADFDKIKDTYHLEKMYFGRHWFPGTYMFFL